MKPFLPREKMSKREKRALDSAKRATWGGVNPITRTTENKKAYNRKKSPRWYPEDSTGIFLYARQVFYSCLPSSGIRYSKNGMIDSRQLAAGIKVMDINTVFCIFCVTTMPLS